MTLAELRREHRTAVEELEAMSVRRFRKALRAVLKTTVARFGATTTAAAEASADDLGLLATLWDEEADETLVPWLDEVYGAGRLGTARRFPDAHAAAVGAVGAGDFNLGVSAYQSEWLATAANRIKSFGSEMWTTARAQLLEGFQAGEGVEKLSKRLTNSFGLLEYRADRIARTEVLSAANAGALAEMRALGEFGPQTKEWMSTSDGRVDAECANLDGESVPLDQPFSSGDDAPPAHPMCRCTTIFGDEASAVVDTVETLVAAAAQEVTMPWHIESNHDSCEPETPWAVVKDEDDEVEGCHATEAEAQEQIDALYASEADGAALGELATALATEAIEAEGGEFHTLMVIEGSPTGDGREFATESLGWRDLPIPLKWQKDEQIGHDGSVLVGRVDRIERKGTELHGWGVFDLGGIDGVEAHRLVNEGFLKGVSVDIDDVSDSDVELIWPEEEESDSEGGLEELFMAPEKTIFHHGRVCGLTLTPMPAFQEAFIELEAEAAEEAGNEEEAVAAAAAHVLTIPSVPPAVWFEEPTDVPIHGALTVTDEGRVYGYLAPASVAHLDPKYKGRRAPMGNVDYSGFMRSETFVEGPDGSVGRLEAGVVTMGCGHAAAGGRSLDHLENTCSLAAKIRVGENRHGVWAAGAVVSDITPAQIERMMLSQFSGEWWPNDRGGQELRAALLVPVPGFPMARTQASTRVVTDHGGVSMVASAVPVRWEDEGERKPDLSRVADRIAASVGRDYKSRARRVAASVKGS